MIRAARACGIKIRGISLEFSPPVLRRFPERLHSSSEPRHFADRYRGSSVGNVSGVSLDSESGPQRPLLRPPQITLLAQVPIRVVCQSDG